MDDYTPYDLNIFFRANHSVVWELADKAGILGQLGLTLQSMEFCETAARAEEALFYGKLDFVSGNHLTPYYWVTKGKPLVAIASPSNSVNGRVITKRPVESLAELKGTTLRVADSHFLDPYGGISHPRANHVLHIYGEGFAPEEVEWVEVGYSGPDIPQQVFNALKEDRADVGIANINRADLQREGWHVLDLPTLPMVNGPTITTSYEALNTKEGLGDRLIKAMVMTVHYARMHPEEAQQLLDARLGRPYQEQGGSARRVARYPMKPYPESRAVVNACELCCLKFPEAREVSPLALWDNSYLRKLDLSGYIDELIQEQPESVRNPSPAGYGRGED